MSVDELAPIDRDELIAEGRRIRALQAQRMRHWHPNDPDCPDDTPEIERRCEELLNTAGGLYELTDYLSGAEMELIFGEWARLIPHMSHAARVALTEAAERRAEQYVDTWLPGDDV